MTRRVLVYPGLPDPRWLQVTFLLCYVAFALSSPGFGRRPEQFLAGFATCLVLDAALLLFYKRVLLFPLSGMISSMGLLLLTDSPKVWPYAAIGALSILSKHFVRADGRHVFNPLNFGIVAGLLFFSGDVAVVADRWGGSLWLMAAIACLGTLTVWRAKRLDLAAAYVAAFLAGAAARAYLSGAPLPLLLTPATGAAFQLFTFFMITDPMTTPEARGPRIAFGLLVGAADAVIRWYQIPNGPLYALFGFSALVPVWRAYAPKVAEKVWEPQALELGPAKARTATRA